MLRVGDALTGDLGDVIEQDPEVRQARTIAAAARTRLVASMTGSQDLIDPAEAQRMLDAFRNALAHAEEAEDQVLVHRGLLTSAEAGRLRRAPPPGHVPGGQGGPARAGRPGTRGAPAARGQGTSSRACSPSRWPASSAWC